MPADRRPPGSPARRRTRRAAAEPGSPPGTLERMWALVLRRFRNHLHDTDTLEQNPTKDDDERT